MDIDDVVAEVSEVRRGDSTEVRPTPLSGGFTCCVPLCYRNSKQDKHLKFYKFPSGTTPEKKELRKKWLDLISRTDFQPTTCHRVCSEHFQGGRDIAEVIFQIFYGIVFQDTVCLPRNHHCIFHEEWYRPLFSLFRSLFDMILPHRLNIYNRMTNRYPLYFIALNRFLHCFNFWLYDVSRDGVTKIR